MYTNHADAEAAIDAYITEWLALVEKYDFVSRITIVTVQYRDDQGETIEIGTHCVDGDKWRALPMVASTYGALQVDHKEWLSKLTQKARGT